MTSTDTTTAARRKDTVVPFTVTGTGTGVAQTVDVDGKHTIAVDTYPSFGGADAAPSPLSYVLAALTSCNQVVSAVVAKDLGLTLGTVHARAVGDLDTAVIAGGAQGNANFDAVRLEVSIETDATEDQLEHLRAETERRCPVSQLFIRSGLEFTNTWTRLPLA